MSNTNDLLNRINAKYSTMSKGHKLLATYITDNYDKAVFLTAAKMGETVGISESTVVRFATSLGYKGYPDFQKALEELVRNKLNSVQRMEVTYGRISQSQILETVLQSDRDKIKTTLEKIDADAFDLAVDTILQSRKIYIVGIRSCAPLASFLAFYMNLMFEDVCLLTTNSSSELFEQMAAHHALVFVGACGIAVRAIAPWITDKLHDSPVLVMDEQGQYVIPLLSGHVGGANELAVRLAEELGAVPVITTATDLHGSFAVDLFAKRNDLWIHNREGIARVSAKILAGEKITMSVQTGHLAVDETIPSEIRLCAYPPVEKVDVLIADNTEEIFRKEAAELLLKPKKYILGAGCKKGTDSVKLEAFLRKILEEQDIAIEQVAALASIDVKKEERCLLEFSERYRIPFQTYPAQKLQTVYGTFHGSDFVKSQVGVDNVCERAAMKAAGADGRICRAKQAQDGMTVAIAEKAWKVSM